MFSIHSIQTQETVDKIIRKFCLKNTFDYVDFVQYPDRHLSFDFRMSCSFKDIEIPEALAQLENNLKLNIIYLVVHISQNPFHSRKLSSNRN